jgi:hypothetical protein
VFAKGTNARPGVRRTRSLRRMRHLLKEGGISKSCCLDTRVDFFAYRIIIFVTFVIEFTLERVVLRICVRVSIVDATG